VEDRSGSSVLLAGGWEWPPFSCRICVFAEDQPIKLPTLLGSAVGAAGPRTAFTAYSFSAPFLPEKPVPIETPFCVFQVSEKPVPIETLFVRFRCQKSPLLSRHLFVCFTCQKSTFLSRRLLVCFRCQRSPFLRPAGEILNILNFFGCQRGSECSELGPFVTKGPKF